MRVFPPIDLFWLVKDSTVIHPKAFAAIQEYMKRKRLPMMASAADLVPYGATVALSFDYAGIGAQTSRIVETLLSGRKKIAGIPIEEPRDLIVVCNRRLIATLLLDDFDARLRDLEAKGSLKVEWRE